MRSRGLTSILAVALVVLFALQAEAFRSEKTPEHYTTPGESRYVTIGGKTPVPLRWKEFTSNYDVEWTLRWDTVRDIPHRALFSGLKIAASVDQTNIEEACRSFVRANESLFGVKESDLAVSRKTLRGKWYVIFDQEYEGVPVYGGRVHFRVAENGNLLLFGSECFPHVDVNASPSVSEQAAVRTAKESVDFKEETDELVETKLLIYPDESVMPHRYHLAWTTRMRTKSPPGNWLVFVDAQSNEVIYSENQIRFDAVSGTVTGFMLPEFYDETPVEMPYAHETVTVPSIGQDNTDLIGDYSIEVGPAGLYPIQSELSGPYVRVMYEDGPEALHSDSTLTSSPHDWAWTAPGDGLIDEINMYYHVVFIHDWIKGAPFYFNGMDYRMIAEVRYGTDYDNAFYDGRDIHFGEGSNAPGGFRNLALFSDVIYHEYTHGIIDHIYSGGGGSQFGAMHEGFADYGACTNNDDPYLGDGGLVFSGGYLRNLDNNRRYPEDFIGQVHNDGLIIGGAMWDLRTYEGRTLTDSLWVYALYGEATLFEDYLIEVLIADDDNGNLGDGTPHACVIYLAFDKHGIGPGPATVDHIPLPDTEDTLNPYQVLAEIVPTIPFQDTIWLLYAIAPDTNYTQMTMDSTGNPDEYEAFIPAQPTGTVVNYYMSLICMTSPIGAPDDSVYSFYVGADTVAPTIVHDPLMDMPLSAWPATAIVEVTDNVGLESVTLEYKRNGLDEVPIPMQRLASTDLYFAQFASGADTSDIFDYRIVAVDSSVNSNTSYEPPDQSYHTFEVCAGFYDDMESGQGDWVHQQGSGGYVDEWHMSQFRNYNPLDSTSWKCGGPNGSNYDDLNHSELITPSIDLELGSVLSFWHRMDAENRNATRAWDGGFVEISTDGGSNWTQITPQGGYQYTIIDNPASPFPAGTPCFSGSHDWRSETFDIGTYSGTVQFRFSFGSDGNVTEEGWYVDEATVYFCPEVGVEESAYLRRIPLFYGMSEAYPNPFSERSALRLELPARSKVELKVYNSAGQLVRTLKNGMENAGYQEVEWDGRDSRQAAVPNGIYFYSLRCSRSGRTVYDNTSKTILLKR